MGRGCEGALFVIRAERRYEKMGLGFGGEDFFRTLNDNLKKFDSMISNKLSGRRLISSRFHHPVPFLDKNVENCQT